MKKSDFTDKWQKVLIPAKVRLTDMERFEWGNFGNEAELGFAPAIEIQVLGSITKHGRGNDPPQSRGFAAEDG